MEVVWTVSTDGLREYVGLRVWLLSVFAEYPCGFSCLTILFLFITGYDSTLYFWSARHKSVKHWVFVFLGFFERGLALFKRKKTLQQHVTAVFLSTTGHKLASLGMLRQAFSSTEALMHRQPTLIFFSPYSLGGRYWLPLLSQHYFRLWSLKKGSPYLDEADILVAEKEQKERLDIQNHMELLCRMRRGSTSR